MASTAAGSVELPDQPMDCCFSPSEPALLASALVTGEVLLHRCRLDGAHVQGRQATAAMAELVLRRPSRKAASCRTLAFTPNGAALAAGFATGSILQLDVSSGAVSTRMTKAHPVGVSRLLTLPGQTVLLAAGDDDGQLCVWDVRAPQAPVLRYKQHTEFISGLEFAERDNALLAVSGDGTLSVHDLRSRQPIARSEDDADDELLSVAVLKGGKKVVTGSQGGVIALWSWGYWADCSDRFPGHPESVESLVKWDEDTVLTGSSDGGLRIVGVLPNRLLGVLGEHEGGMPIEQLALSGDRKLLASASHEAGIALWDMGVLADDSGDDDEDDEDNVCKAEETGANEGAGAASGSQPESGAPVDVPSCGQRRPLAAAAAAAVKDGRDGAAAGGSNSSGDDDSDADTRGTQRKRPKKATGNRTSGKPSRGGGGGGSGNFFSDLL